MCMLTYLPATVQPNIDALATGSALNDDGHGFAIVTADRLLVRRGMDAERMLATFARLRAKHPDGPALFHSRFATHGGITKANIHPFRVGADRLTVLAHNGILPAGVQPGKNDRRSDTRIAAEDVLTATPFESFDDWATVRRIETWMGAGNKIVVLTVNPRYREHAYVLNEGSGVWDGDTWYSNTDYLGRLQLTEPWWISDSPCVFCHATDEVDPYSGVCLSCDRCAVCGELSNQCGPRCPRIEMSEWCPDCGQAEINCECAITSMQALTIR
jgi:predicted glutamine amidotransferase